MTNPSLEETASKLNLFKVSGLGLYGREKETKALVQSYEDAKTSRRLVLIGGPSGRGKSALSKYLQRYSEKKGDLQASGKYTLTQEGEPYSAITQACAEMCQKIAAGKSLETCRDAIRSEMPLEAIDMISRIIPQINCIVDDEESQSVEDPNESKYMDEKNQLHLSLRHFFQIVCRFVQVVLCLDDLQWADAASIELLEFLLTDHKNSKLLVVVCFRDDEVSDTHAFARLLRNKKIMKDRDGLGVTDINVDNLSVEAIDEMLKDVLEGKSQGTTTFGDTLELATVIQNKTKGNPFFTLQFWYLLGEDGLVRHNDSTDKWEWDVDEIRVFAHTIEDIVDLMQTKFKTLSLQMQNLLQLSACLGTVLHADVLNVVVKDYNSSSNVSLRSFFSNEVKSTLNEVSVAQFVEELYQRDFLEPINDAGYRWAHDKIQEAAYKLMPSKKRRQLLLKLGDLLSKELSTQQLDKSLFTVVRLRNESSHLIPTTDSSKRVDLAEMNLKAGKLSIAASDFGAASNHFGKAVKLLPSNKWRVHHELCLELYSLATEADYCAGNFEAMEQHGNEVVKRHNLSTLQKRRAYMAFMLGLAAQGKYKEAATVCMDLLSKLNCKIPRHLVLLRILPGLMNASSSVDKYTKSDDIMDKIISEEEKLWVMSLLDSLFNYAYVAELNDIVAAAIVKSYQWTVKYGFCSNSPTTFARVGMALSTSLGKVTEGHEYACQAIRLLSGVKDKRVVSRVMFVAYVFVHHRRSDVNYHRLVEGHEAGITAGNVEMGCWNSFFALEHGLLSGKVHLDSLNADASPYAIEMRELKQDMVHDCTRMISQFIANLRGGDGNSGRAVLTGGVIDESTILDGVENGTKPAIYHQVFKRFQYVAAFWFEDWDRFLEVYNDTPEAAIHKAMPGLFVSHIITAYVSLGMMSLYRLNHTKKYLTLAKSHKAKLKQFVSEGNPNFVHFLRLVEAEQLDLVGGPKKRNEADTLYKAATQIAFERGAVNDEALCCQRHGEYYLRHGQNAEGKLLLERALEKYEAWGSWAKVQQLKEKHASIF